jgi:hypothetical protein
MRRTDLAIRLGASLVSSCADGSCLVPTTTTASTTKTRSMKRGRKIRGAVRDVVAGRAGRGVGTRPAGSGDAGVCPRWLRGRPAGQRGCEVGRVRGRQLPSAGATTDSRSPG